MKRRLLSLLLLASLATACAAADRKSGAQAPQSPPADANTGSAAGAAYGGQPGQPAYAQPPPPPPSSTSPSPTGPSQSPAEPRPEPQASPATPPLQMSAAQRSASLNKASNDIEAAQRELDVANSSCQNACRALGSMDRAAGQICLLTREDNTHDRCDAAKGRLYNARDRVRNTCGTCPDNQPATDRNAPVPSVH